MPTVVYVGAAGLEQAVDATAGDSVMSAAVRSGIPGIIGECGGNASCGTCHVWVREPFLEVLPDIGDLEEDLLEMAVTDRRASSRLSCQLPVSPALDGLTVDIPPVQP